MTLTSILWFAGQFVAALLAAVLGWRVGKRSARLWRPVAVLAAVLMLLWPLLRFFPTLALGVFDACLLIFVEVTGIVVPAAVLFAIAAEQLQQQRQRRAVRLLLLVCLLYFVRSGAWMIGRPVPDMKISRYNDGVCRQSTGYTCVAAALVTMLRGFGIESTETEMARLSYTEIGNGSTDMRAVCALQHKLAGRPLAVRYERMGYARLREIALPCLVPIKWGYYISHMVAVLEVHEDRVVLGDPLVGRREMPRGEFDEEWLSRAVFLAPTANDAERATTRPPADSGPG